MAGDNSITFTLRGGSDEEFDQLIKQLASMGAEIVFRDDFMNIARLTMQGESAAKFLSRIGIGVEVDPDGTFHIR